jgi:spore maturation protein CgeB
MRQRLSIAFFGSSLVSAYWNGAATYYRGIIRALHRRGHRVTFYEPDAYDRQKHRDIADPDWARVVVYDHEDLAHVERLLAEAQRADLVVKASGVGVLDTLLEEAVAGLGRSGLMTAFWDVDAPATLARLAADPADPFRRCLPRYDVILTYGGGDPVVRTYGSFGARRCVPIYNGLDPETHFPVPRDERFAADLALLANRLPDRERRVDEFFFKPAAQLPTHRFLLGGNGWDDRPMPPHLRYLGHVYTRDHNAFNCSALAVLNVARDSMAAVGFSPATRVFEAAGAGACIISDAWEGIETFLEPGREILVARDGDEVAAHLGRLDEGRARRIGEAARQRVLAQHTYAARVELLEKVLEGAVA